MEQDFFNKKGIPVLAVEGTAHADPVTEEIKMRVKAFIEMLAEEPALGRPRRVHLQVAES
jgi:hypothetical protein